MKRIITFCLLVIPAIAQEHAPKHELAFQLGGFSPLSRTSSGGNIDLGSGVAFQSNYGRRLYECRYGALYGEVHFLASPLREISSNVLSATRDVASLYVAPGVRVKFAPVSAVSPYVVAGGGPAWYEQSTQQLNGAANTASRETVRAAFNFGGGMDIHVWRWLALRGEVRDFITGSPSYNIASIGGRQHNVVAGAAFVLRWH